MSGKTETRDERMSLPPLTSEALGTDPLSAFGRWLTDAEGGSGMRYPNAVLLSTVDADGIPEGRIMLLKGWDARGFLFYTNYQSAKGESLELHPWAGLTFYWDAQGRQIRAKGMVRRLSVEESDAYFLSRPRESRIGAWASAQSAPLESREALEAQITAVDERFRDADVPRPPQWGGYLLEPVAVEFWQEGAYRLHDRFRFTRTAPGGPWTVQRLNP